MSKNLSLTSAPEPSDPAPTDLQMSLFNGWHSKNPAHSRTLDFFDSLPKFSLTHTRAVKKASILRFDDVQIAGHRVSVSIAPAIIASKGRKQSKAAASEEDAKLIFPGVREELVEMAIRKLAVQQTVSTGLHVGRQTGTHIIRVTFTLSQLRQELTSAGHSLMLSQIREALEVLSRAVLTVEAEHDRTIHGMQAPILQNLRRQQPKGDVDGSRSYISVDYHPLATKAIIDQAYKPINYTRVMRVGLPLARWIITRMSQRYRQASRQDMVEGRGYILTLSRVLAESGITAEERQRNTIDRVRQALKELKEQGFLHPMKPYDERPVYERTKGRPKIIEMEWKLFPSSTFVGEIVEGNIEMKDLKQGAEGAKVRRLGNRKSESSR